jgi:FKBP-type peptidyl-prolyl cis-trans isomerase
LQKVASNFEEKARSAFIDAFHSPSSSSRMAPSMTGVSSAMFEGLKKARRNLDTANARFETLSLDNSLLMIIPKQLYFKTMAEGSGKELKEADLVRMGYVIEDREGCILFANHDIWLNLSQTIPGFAHSVQGMHVGEKRKLFIHPVLAYGALTTLPPCSELTITVQLLDIDEKVSGALPALTPLDLSWIQDPVFYHHIEESLEQRPRFMGSFYRDLLDKMQDIDTAAILSVLNHS